MKLPLMVRTLSHDFGILGRLCAGADGPGMCVAVAADIGYSEAFAFHPHLTNRLLKNAAVELPKLCDVKMRIA